MTPLLDLASHCIRCGFCLESCPTFVLTGEETESPRGRIYLARSAEEGLLDWKDVKPHLDRCLGCRACETACPSGVQYGEILEIARDQVERRQHHITKDALLGSLTDADRLGREIALAKLWPGKRAPRALSWLISREQAEADLPRRQVDDLGQQTLPLPPPGAGGEVYLLEGCAMKALYPRVHSATRRLLARIGFQVRDVKQGCCGALHAHNGYLDKARRRARKLMASFPDNLPIIVNSAGCGSTMKEYGDLVGPEAKPLAQRTFDLTEFLLDNGLEDALGDSLGIEATATYHDACHLAHGQGVRNPPRQLLQAIPNLNLVDLNESDMCCGSGGIYNLTQPKQARELLERKWQNIADTGASIVASGNPGCHAWIGQAAREHGGEVRVVHTAELLEASFSGLPQSD